MNHREISEMLRNPDGQYFAEGAPAMIALESMVDTMGMGGVLYALTMIASEKAEHVLSNWQDKELAKAWQANALVCATAANKAKRTS